MHATVSAGTARAALEIARRNGLDAEGLALRCGLRAGLADEARVDHAVWIGLWHAIVEATGDDRVGLRAAEALPFGHFDVLDYLLATSDDLGTALTRFSRHFGLVSTGVSHAIERREGSTWLVRRYAPGCETRLLAPAEFAFANVMVRTRRTSGVAWRPRAVWFASVEPRWPEDRRRFFDCPVHFGAPTSAIELDDSTLALPMRGADANLLGILERHAAQLVASLAGEDGHDESVIARTRRAIVEGMRGGDVSLEGVARRLGTSPRTLQRRLQEDGASFDAVLDEERHTLARRYLHDESLSIDQACDLLAFAQPRGFRRAFRRWEGCTPSEYRTRATVARAAPSPSRTVPDGAA